MQSSSPHATVKPRAPVTVGLTGGIASGKSSVSRLLAERGAVIVDADRIARDLVRPGTEGLAALVAALGAEILAADGTLDRPRLGARVFGDAEALRRLNGIMGPRIAAESRRQIAAAQGAALVVYDAALIVEWGQADAFRPLVVVTAPPAVQQARLMARDGLTAEAAQARIAAQLPVADKARLADHVLDNAGEPEALAAQVEALWQTLVP